MRSAPLGLVVALAAAACTPPVLFPVKNDDWTLAGSRYPVDTRVVELERPDEPTLRGIFVPSDDAAPLVVHFAESGGSIVGELFTRSQYEDLAERGFASLALDYRGIGLSDGSTSPRAIDDDARAMYEHALELVGGDETRLVVRGTSLGTLAIASLLDDGIRPAAVVMYAPVLAETVAVRYGQATLWDPLVWIARPFLRSFIDTDLVEAIAHVDVPLLLVVHKDDELLSDREYESLKAAVARAGGKSVEATTLFNLVVEGESAFGDLEIHVGLAGQSYHLHRAERALLAEHFPDAPDRSTRRSRIEAEGDRELLARVRVDADANARLEALIEASRLAPANALLAGALHFEEAETVMLLLGQGPRDPLKNPVRARSPEGYDRFFDHDDPAGTIPWTATLLARNLFMITSLMSDAPIRDAWPVDRVLDLTRALLGETSDEFSYDSAKREVWVTNAEDHRGRPRSVDGLLESLEEAELPEQDLRRQLLRVLLKGTRHVERVVAGRDGSLVEVRSAVEPIRIDPATLSPLIGEN